MVLQMCSTAEEQETGLGVGWWGSGHPTQQPAGLWNPRDQEGMEKLQVTEIPD